MSRLGVRPASIRPTVRFGGSSFLTLHSTNLHGGFSSGKAVVSGCNVAVCVYKLIVTMGKLTPCKLSVLLVGNANVVVRGAILVGQGVAEIVIKKGYIVHWYAKQQIRRTNAALSSRRCSAPVNLTCLNAGQNQHL